MGYGRSDSSGEKWTAIFHRLLVSASVSFFGRFGRWICWSFCGSICVGRIFGFGLFSGWRFGRFLLLRFLSWLFGFFWLGCFGLFLGFLRFFGTSTTTAAIPTGPWSASTATTTHPRQYGAAFRHFFWWTLEGLQFSLGLTVFVVKDPAVNRSRDGGSEDGKTENARQAVHGVAFLLGRSGDVGDRSGLARPETGAVRSNSLVSIDGLINDGSEPLQVKFLEWVLQWSGAIFRSKCIGFR